MSYLGLSIDEEFAIRARASRYLSGDRGDRQGWTHTAIIVHEQNVSPRIIATYGPPELRKRAVLKIHYRRAGNQHCADRARSRFDGAAITTIRSSMATTVNGKKVSPPTDRADMYLVYAR